MKDDQNLPPQSAEIVISVMQTYSLAVQIFNDPLLYTEYDKENSEKHSEHREMQIGRLGNFITLSVSTTDREDKIRIISARKSTKEEIKIYEQNAKNL